MPCMKPCINDGQARSAPRYPKGLRSAQYTMRHTAGLASANSPNRDSVTSGHSNSKGASNTYSIGESWSVVAYYRHEQLSPRRSTVGWRSPDDGGSGGGGGGCEQQQREGLHSSWGPAASVSLPPRSDRTHPSRHRPERRSCVALAL